MAMTPAVSRMGKKMAERMPSRRLSPESPDTKPARVGPPEQPRSPPKASMAKRAVPPEGIDLEARLKVPGHMIPTEKPQRAQPISPMTGFGIREMHR